MINIENLNLDFNNLKRDSLDLIIYNNNEELSRILNLSLQDFYTKLFSWLNNDHLDLFEYENFQLHTENGEDWILECDQMSFIVNIDDTILAVWRLLSKLEVQTLKQFQIDLNL